MKVFLLFPTILRIFLLLEYSRAGESCLSFSFLKQFPGRSRSPAANARSCQHRALTEFLRSSKSDVWPLMRSERAFSVPHLFHCLQEEAREGEQCRHTKRETPPRHPIRPCASLLWVFILFRQREFLRAVSEQGRSRLSWAGQNTCAGKYLAEQGARRRYSRAWGSIPQAAPPCPVCPFSPAAGWGQEGIFFPPFFPPLLCTVKNFPIPPM